MRTFVAILALVAAVAADVRSPEADAQIVKQTADVFPDKYEFSYETNNNIAAYESGVLKNVGREDEAIEVQGGNQYVGPDGVLYKVTYTADASGYHPSGDHLPTPPPTQAIPDYILRSIEYNRLNSKPEPQRP